MEKNGQDNGLLQEVTIEPFSILQDLLKNWWAILLGALATAMLLLTYEGIRYEPEYTTSATFIVTSQEGGGRYANINSASEMAITFQKILESHSMEKMVCEELGMERLDADISGEVVEGTNMLTLRVSADNPKDAIDIITSVMDHYSEVSFYALGSAVMNVLEEPTIPFSADNPMDSRGILKKGFVLGLGLFVLLFGFYSYNNSTIKKEKDVERKLDARLLGGISFERKYHSLKERRTNRKKALLLDDHLASFGFVEEYKKLAVKVEYHLAKTGGKSLVVSSVSENEGKSTVAANLALALSDDSKKVLLVDGDLRRPSQFLIFGMEINETNELGEFIKGQGKIKDIILKTDRKNLRFAGGKNCYTSGLEVTNMEAWKKFLQTCKKTFDYIIIDAPPLGVVGDAYVLGECADAVAVVVKQNFIQAEEINEVLDDFRDNEVKVLGVILNEVKSFSRMVNGPVVSYGKYGKYGLYSRYSDK